MTMLGAKVIRLKVLVSEREVRVDAVTGNAPHTWRGVPVKFQLGFFRDSQTVLSLSELASITLEGKHWEARKRPALFSNTIAQDDFDNSLDLESWEDGSKCHVEIPFTAEEMGLALPPNKDSRKFWCVISGLTTDSPALEPTFTVFGLTLEEDGHGSVVIPPLPLTEWYTRTESDARYLMRSEVGLETRWHDGKLYIQNSDNPTYWHPLIVTGSPTQPVWSLGPGEEL